MILESEWGSQEPGHAVTLLLGDFVKLFNFASPQAAAGSKFIADWLRKTGIEDSDFGKTWGQLSPGVQEKRIANPAVRKNAIVRATGRPAAYSSTDPKMRSGIEAQFGLIGFESGDETRARHGDTPETEDWIRREFPTDKEYEEYVADEKVRRTLKTDDDWRRYYASKDHRKYNPNRQPFNVSIKSRRLPPPPPPDEEDSADWWKKQV